MFAIGLVLVVLSIVVVYVDPRSPVDRVFGRTRATDCWAALGLVFGLDLITAALAVLAWKALP